VSDSSPVGGSTRRGGVAAGNTGSEGGSNIQSSRFKVLSVEPADGSGGPERFGSAEEVNFKLSAVGMVVASG
jgi:hypothetical protein